MFSWNGRISSVCVPQVANAALGIQCMSFIPSARFAEADLSPAAIHFISESVLCIFLNVKIPISERGSKFQVSVFYI